MDHVKIEYSNGHGKCGRQYAFIRPAKECFNRSRRVPIDSIEKAVAKHFPVVNYYEVDGRVIGAKDELAAMAEYWRVCDRAMIGKRIEVKLIEK